MKRPTLLLIVTGFLLAGLPVLAQPPATPAPVISPEVHADRTVTFRLRAPNAQEVLLGREGAQRVAMQKGSEGIWTYTTDALEPDFYGYSFVVDGVSLVDPSNSVLKPNLLNLTSMFHVPGASGMIVITTSTRRPVTSPARRRFIPSCTCFTAIATMLAAGAPSALRTSSSIT
jgi:hypothetical protein